MSELRTLLRAVDGSAPAIQKAAGAMMRHYDRSADVAVTEWRNALQATRATDQLLPLLYVANEVLQNSKRNRGNKFLVAFSPILGQALQHICQCASADEPGVTERVRRTTKIWADRRVFSVRFVNELLQGLEPYREGGSRAPAAAPQAQAAAEETSEGASFSPQTLSQSSSATTTAASSDKQQQDSKQDDGESSDDDIMALLEQDDHSAGGSDGGSNNDDDDDDNLFADKEDSQKLVLDFNLDSPLEPTTAQQQHHRNRRGSAASNSRAKRRRSSTASAGSQSSSHNHGAGGPAARKRKSVLSASNMVDVWNRLVALNQEFTNSQLTLQAIDSDLRKHPPSELSELVGDELQHAFRQNQRHQAQIADEEANLHAVATERRSLEQEALRYLPFLERALRHDEDDIRFCDDLREKILAFRKIHGSIRTARDVRAAAETKKQRELEELERKRREKEENDKFRRAALAKETEAKPGMVWNPSTREYQSLNTEESWRD